jgi:hypothetical protein
MVEEHLEYEESARGFLEYLFFHFPVWLPQWRARKSGICDPTRPNPK